MIKNDKNIYNDTQNPFSLAFGREPFEVVSRTAQTQKVIDAFERGDGGSQAYIITGLRGAGKTVLLTEISRRFDAMDDWQTVDLNPNREMLSTLISKLSSTSSLKEVFSSLKVSINIPGVSISFGGKDTITDPEMALEKMLTAMKKKGKRLLVTIDEVDNRPEIRAFATTFKMMIRKDLPMYLLMTGLYENVSDLQNDSNMTFLLRAPKLPLTALSRIGIISAYKRSCDVPEETAKEMADLTKGYAFAFQLLGYLYWNGKYKDNSTDIGRLLPEYDQQLEEFVYAKIWSTMSAGDQEWMRAITAKDRYRVSDLLADCGADNSRYSVYRRRLADKGLIDVSERGYVSATLPRFGEFIRNRE